MKKKCIKSWIKSAEDLKNSEKSGKVHSRYKNVVNLFIEGRFFSVHNSKISMTSLSIIVEDALEVQRDDTVIIMEHGIQVGRELLEYGNVETWNPVVERRIPLERAKVVLKELKTSLIEYKSHAGYADSAVTPIGEKDDFLTAILRKRVWKLKSDFLEHVLSEQKIWEDFLKENIGAGIGLTPSGDDFIVGLLFAMKCSDVDGIFEKLVEIVEENLEYTNDISGAFLKSACKGEFSQKLHELAKGISEEKESIKEEIDNIASSGHSSGVDTLNGIVVGWELLIEEKRKGNKKDEIL